MEPKRPTGHSFAPRLARAAVHACWGVGAAVALSAMALPLLLSNSHLGRSSVEGRLVQASFTGGASTASDCVSCHRFDAMFSHPVDVRPQAHVPDTLPLEQGRMTCATCHDEEALEGHTTRTPKGDPALRGSMPVPSLCAQCHAATGGSEGGRSGAGSAHASGLHIAHLDSGSRRPAGSGKTGRLDDESRGCMTCHDGTSAGDAGMHSGTRSRAKFNPEQDHPIGIPYKGRRASADADEIRLVETHSLDPRIRLFDGQVGCGSCHSVYAPAPNLVVMPMLRSQLCFGCHIE